MTRLAIVNSGVANLASLKNAFDALGARVTVTTDPAEVAAASHVVLPGVGSFEAGISALRQSGIDRAVKEGFERGQPLLAVCLGMQMLAESSAESPGVSGLGIIAGSSEALPNSVPVPHLGWNYVEAAPDSEILAHGYAAFANSFCLTEPPDGWEAAWTIHGTRFVSALVRGRTMACQFHPELSGRWGLELLDRWLRRGTRAAPEAVTQALVAGVTRRIIPCLDVRYGRVVKGVNFQRLRDAGDPATQAACYEAQGADEIVMLDIAATPDVGETQLATVGAIRAQIHISLTVGGGVRKVEDARRLLAAGADKVSVNTAAVKDPSLLTCLAREFGTQCVVLAIDARLNGDGWEVLVAGGRESTGINAIEWAREGVTRGAGEILLTSWDRDGTRSGCDLALLRAVTGVVPTPVIASGGIGSRDDVADAFGAGADAVLAASIFHDGNDTVMGIKQHLKDRGLAVRQ